MQNVLGWLMQFGPFGFIAIGVGVFVMLMLLAGLAARQRTKSLNELANSLGFSFQPRADLSMIYELPQFQLFTQGHSQRIDNLLSGSSESTQVQMFDWRYVTGHGKHASNHHTTVVVIQSADLDLAAFYCRPENLLDWVGLTFDGKDIDFEDRPLFSKRFHLHGTIENKVRRLFDVQVCEFFEGHLGMYAEGNRQWLLYYQHDGKVAANKLQERFQEAFQLYLLLKVRSVETDMDDSAAAITDQARDEMSSEAQ